MIGLDTNVLVRYLTLDDPVQSPAAIELIDSLSQADPGFISLIVMVELVWVLESSYRFQKDRVKSVLEALLRSQDLVIERTDVVWQALRSFAASRADFSDCLIERCSDAAQCAYTATFDKKGVQAGMRLIR
jgi:predicted nucleic-acid-binding protein